MPIISIIIPVFDVEKYLNQCLDSVINQTLTDIEIIIVTDGPQSNHDICDKYLSKDRRIKIVKDVNRGLGGARNAALNIAKGKYIAFLDGDDWLDNTALEKLVAEAEEKKLDMLFFQTSMVSENGKKQKTDVEYYLPILSKFNNKIFSWNDISFQDILNFRMSVVAWNKIYRKNFLEHHNLQFPEKLRYEDNVFFFKAFTKATKCGFLAEVLYYYRQRKTSLAHTNKSNKNSFDLILIWKEIKKYFLQNYKLNSKCIKILNERIIDDLSNAIAKIHSEYMDEFIYQCKINHGENIAKIVKRNIPVIKQIKVLNIPIVTINTQRKSVRYTFFNLISLKIKNR